MSITKITAAVAADSDFVLESEKGEANGVASLDGSGKVPAGQLPPGSSGSLTYQGTWNATTNNPALASGVGGAGEYYVVGTGGSTNLDGVSSWAVGDWVVFNGTAWEKADHTDQVSSVYGRTGTVSASNGDYSAGQITNTPSGAIAATTVQAALNELDSEKAASSHTHTLSTITDSGALAALDTVDSAEIANNAVSNVRLANMAADRIKGRATGGGSGDPQDLTPAQVMAVLAGSALDMEDAALTRPLVVDYAVESTSPVISGGTLTLNLQSGNDFDVSWDANISTLSITNWPSSGRLGKLTLRLAMDGTTRTISWPAAVDWPGGTAPTNPGINEDIEVVMWSRDGGTTVQAAEIGKAFA